MTTDDLNEPAMPETAEEGWSLENFTREPDDQGLSLEDLGNAFAALLGKGHDPYEPIANNLAASPEEAVVEQQHEILDQAAQETEGDTADDGCEISPRTIVEAMLFVGHPNNEPMTASQLASLMRGVRAEEVEAILRELNEAYRDEGAPYYIASEGAGFRLALRDEFRNLRDNFYGRVKEARLSQFAVDVLAIVAYNQPLTREQVDALRDKESGAILMQLVRRGLLQIERRDDDSHIKYYRTTKRFLELFGLESLDDLPRTQDLDRALG